MIRTLTPTALTPAARSAFDKFLYAPIAEEHNGMLSMLSALARLNVDPWDEAARLARLPREAATRVVTALIAALPDGPSARTDPGAIAERLIALLPRPLATQPVMAFPGNRYSLRRIVFLYVVLMLVSLGAQWLLARPHETARFGTAAAPTGGAASPVSPAPTSAPKAASSRN
jgi:hypothetical protein